MALALLPKVKSISQHALEALDQHTLQVLIEHDTVSFLSSFPFVKVFCNLAIDHGLDRGNTTILTRTNSCLGHYLHVFVKRLDSRHAVAL